MLFIYMYGDCELKIDCNMEKEVFLGKNIVLFIEKLYILEGIYLINVFGKDVEKLVGESFIYDGMNGRNGNNVGILGDIILFFKEIEKRGEFKFYVDGGCGGNG